MMTYDLMTIGEILMDMTPHCIKDQVMYQANPGGAPFNVLKMAKAYKLSAAFVGKVGADPFGKTLRDELLVSGIDDKWLIETDQFNTSLAFVHLDARGERHFSFYRKSSADYALDKDELPLEDLKCHHFYFGSVALSRSPMDKTLKAYLHMHRSAMDLVFFDPNYRPFIWSDADEALEAIQQVLAYVDVIKVSEEEALWMTGAVCLDQAIDRLHQQGIGVVYLTRGHLGTRVSLGHETRDIPPRIVQTVVDTTGAGDAFFGSVIGYLIEKKSKGPLGDEDFFKAGYHGNIAGSICVESYGAVPSYPSKAEIEVGIHE